MRQLIPQFILQQLANGRHSGSFSAASLFIDVAGFSYVTDVLMTHGEHGAEVLAELIKSVFEPLVESAHEQGGFVATISGDALMVLFIEKPGGAPASHRALAAARHGLDRQAITAEQTTPYGTFAMPTKAGIATGRVEWGIISADDDSRAAYFFRGEAVEGSARAEQTASAGEIILGPAAFEQVSALIDAGTVGRRFRVRSIKGSLPPAIPIKAAKADESLMARFFPRELLLQPHEGEFRHVVSLFVGLPALLNEKQLSSFLRLAFNLQDRYAGLFSRLEFDALGARLLLFWGAPRANENDIERALSFLIDLRTQSDIPFCAGITYTIAYAGFIGGILRQDYTVYGRGINLAARFNSEASQGEIWADEQIVANAGAQFEFENDGARRFKGFTGPQEVHRLLHRKETGIELDRHEMVGREKELAALTQFVQNPLDKSYAGVMLISGEAGIGKSRLVQQLQATAVAGEADMHWALCQTDEIVRESLNPFSYWLRRYFGQAEKQSRSRNLQSFNAKMDQLIASTSNERLAAELKRTGSLIGALVGVFWPDSLYEQLDAQGRYENTMQGLVAIVQAESLRQSLVLIVEDVQWLDRDSVALLKRLDATLGKRGQHGWPVAIIATARPGGDELLRASGVAFEEIRLGQMSPTALEELARDRLGGRSSPELLDLLGEQAHGNPFYATQIMLYLQERDLLKEGPAGWELSSAGETTLPPDVRALLVARLDTLTREVRAAVQTASVLGKEFELRILARMLETEEPSKVGIGPSDSLQGWIVTAEQAAIWTALTQIRYMFRHALLRDAAYSMQLHSRLRALHQAAVDALETFYEAEENMPYAELGHHADRAGIPEKARRYLQLAGDRASEAFQNHLAAQYYARALELTPQDHLELRFQLLMARAKVLQLSGDREGQRVDLKALLEMAVALGPAHMAKVKLEMARMEGSIGAYDEAIAAAAEAVELAHDENDVSVLAGGYLQWGWFLYRQSDFAGARDNYEKSRTYAQAAQLPAEEANSLNGLGILATEEGEFAESAAFYERARELYGEAGRLAGEGNILNNLAVLAVRQGQYVEAKRYCEQALALRRKIGDRKGEGNTANNLGEVCRALGQYSEAEQHFHNSLEIRREVGDRRGEALVNFSLALLLTDFGEYRRAYQLLGQSLTLAREIDDRMIEGLALSNQGNVAVDLGDVEEGLASAGQAVLILRQVDNQLYLGQALRLLGAALFQKGLLAQAVETLQEGAVIARQMDPYLLAQIDAGLAEVALAAGDGSEAMLHAEAALTFLLAGDLARLEDPVPIALSCYLVLMNHEDPRASDLLRAAYRLLRDRADRIPDPVRREAYLSQVQANRAIVAAAAA